MADEMMKKCSAPADVDAEIACDAPVDELEPMREEIAGLQEKEAVLSEKLSLAKEKGLADQADRCRILLQKVVRCRQKKQEELRVAEARALAAELDTLTEEISAELGEAPVPYEETDEYNYLAKSRRLGLISRMIGFIGVFGCFVGAFVYLLLTQVETLNLPFEWIYLIGVGVGAVAFLVIALLVGASAGKYRRLAEEAEAQRLEDEAALALLAAEEAFTTESLNATTEAYEIEKNLELANAKPKTLKLMLEKLPTEVPEKVKKNVHKIVPVAAVCTAIVAAFAVSSSRKRAAAERHSAAVRRDFFKWLG